MSQRSNFHIVINALGTHGDIHPLVGLGAGLLKRGYMVSFLANEYFRDFIEEHGIRFVSLGAAHLHTDYYSDPRVWNPQQDQLEILFDEMTRDTIKRGFDFVSDERDKGKTVVVVSYRVVANGSRMAADLYGMPSILVSLAPSAIPTGLSYTPFRWIHPYWIPFALRSLLSRAATRQRLRRSAKMTCHIALDQIRKSFGLEPVKYDDLSNERLHLCFFPEWFAVRPADWPGNLRIVGFPLFDRVQSSAHDIVDQFIAAKGKPIVFTAGTAFYDTLAIFREGRKICEALDMPGIFVGGLASKHVLEGSDDLLHIDYVDFNYLLPKCAAIVHHGGIGTTSQAIRAKIPQVIRPVIFDQPDNAYRLGVLNLGVGIEPKYFSAEVAAPYLKNLIVNAADNADLRRYSDSLKRGNAIERACDVIDEDLLESAAL